MIFTQTTCRDFLRYELNRRCHDNPLYSMHAFAKRCGISHAYLSLILSGKRRITRKVAEKIASKAGLGAVEKNYLLLLAKLECTQDQDLRKHVARDVTSFRNKIGAEAEDVLAFEAISDWYYSAILEVVTIGERFQTPAAIAAKLDLPKKIVESALRKLVRLGMLAKNGDLYQRVNSGHLRTSSEVKSLALRKFHKQILRMGQEAIESQSVDERSVTGLTVAFNPELLPEVKKRILDFQRELSSLLQGDGATEVYQMQIQLFRLSKKEES